MEIKHRFRKIFAFFGPGALIAVGYMDPGNWATDLAGGAKYGYELLSVVFLANLLAILLQHLSLKLGIVTGLDLAQACRKQSSKPVTIALWLLCEVAIVACDLAEVIGAAIAFQLLFGWPLWAGVVVTALDVIVLLLLPDRKMRWIEFLVVALIAVIAGCFTYELGLAKPIWSEAWRGLWPHFGIVHDAGKLFIAVGILGATVMPHNLYLHSSLIQAKPYLRTEAGRREGIWFGGWDSALALFVAFFVNAAILVLSAAVFHGTKSENVADISDAYRLLSPALGAPIAGVLFAVALLASGQNSTLTGTMAGQVVMEGFLDIRLKPWLRRLVTRSLAIVPACFVAIHLGERRIGDLLLLSQVVLSLQLSFAVVPLVMFTSSKKLMGPFANGPGLKALAWGAAILIAALNLWLVGDYFFGKTL